jgi:hypothetical protein
MGKLLERDDGIARRDARDCVEFESVIAYAEA